MKADLYRQLVCACLAANADTPPTASNLAFLLREWIAARPRYEEVKCTMLQLADEGAVPHDPQVGYLGKLDELYRRACVEVDVARVMA